MCYAEEPQNSCKSGTVLQVDDTFENGVLNLQGEEKREFMTFRCEPRKVLSIGGNVDFNQVTDNLMTNACIKIHQDKKL